MNDELIRLRAWAAQRLRAGAVPEWSWNQHTTLIDAIDAVLHDIAIVKNASDVTPGHLHPTSANRQRAPRRLH